MGNDNSTRLKANAPSIATNPPRSLLVMVSNGAETPASKPVGEAEVAEPVVVGEAMTNGSK
jgi:hypothetical protein